MKRILCVLVAAALLVGTCPALAAGIPASDPPARSAYYDDAGLDWRPLEGSDYWLVSRQKDAETTEYAIYSAEKPRCSISARMTTMAGRSLRGI